MIIPENRLKTYFRVLINKDENSDNSTEVWSLPNREHKGDNLDLKRFGIYRVLCKRLMIANKWGYDT